jgi:hypothetical protein
MYLEKSEWRLFQLVKDFGYEEFIAGMGKNIKKKSNIYIIHQGHAVA